MNADRKQDALDAIHDLALKLKSVTDAEELKSGLDDIMAIARYGFDVTPHGDPGEHA